VGGGAGVGALVTPGGVGGGAGPAAPQFESRTPRIRSLARSWNSILMLVIPPHRWQLTHAAQMVIQVGPWRLMLLTSSLLCPLHNERHPGQLGQPLNRRIGTVMPKSQRDMRHTHCRTMRVRSAARCSAIWPLWLTR
jgi:hypothetical protein